MRQRRPLLLLLAMIALVGAAWSYALLVNPAQPTPDQRAYYIAEQLKCPVCQNESVADSSASIAQQMRQVIRQQLQQGRSDQQILQYFADHYGNQILLTPPAQGFNLLAWWMPVLMLLLGLGLLAWLVRDLRGQTGTPLTSRAPDSASVEALALDPELEQYRHQLEQELADADPLMEID